MKHKRFLAALAVVALAAVGCGGDDGEDGGDTGGGNGGGDAVTLTALDFEFEPTDLTVSAGGSVELVNDGEAEHNLTVEGTDVDEDVAAGETVTVDLGDVEAGTYEFVCEYHADQMTGTLTVE